MWQAEIYFKKFDNEPITAEDLEIIRNALVKANCEDICWYKFCKHNGNVAEYAAYQTVDYDEWMDDIEHCLCALSALHPFRFRMQESDGDEFFDVCIEKGISDVARGQIVYATHERCDYYND